MEAPQTAGSLANNISRKHIERVELCKMLVHHSFRHHIEVTMSEPTKSALALQKQLEAATEKVKQLKARKAQIDARERAKVSKEKRAEDSRRKILIGAYVLSMKDREQIQKMMDQYLSEDRDRALFGLPPKATSKPGA